MIVFIVLSIAFIALLFITRRYGLLILSLIVMTGLLLTGVI